MRERLPARKSHAPSAGAVEGGVLLHNLKDLLHRLFLAHHAQGLGGSTLHALKAAVAEVAVENSGMSGRAVFAPPDVLAFSYRARFTDILATPAVAAQGVELGYQLGVWVD